MVKLAARNLLRHGARTGAALAAIVFGVVGIIFSGGFVEDLYVHLREWTIHSRLGHLQVYREGHYLQGRADPFAFMIEEPERLTAQIAGNPEVVDVLRRVNFAGLLNNGRTDLPIAAEGVEPDKEARLGSFVLLVDGRHLADTDESGVMLGEGVAQSLKLGVGDFATLLVNTPEGALNTLEVQVVGVFRTFSKEFDARAVRMGLRDAQTLLDTQAVHALVVSLSDTAHTDRVAANLRTALTPLGFEVWTWLELDDFYPKTVDLYERQFGMLQGIMLVIVLLSVLSSLSMTAHERVGEFGTLKALGHTTGHVYRLMLVESVLLGLLGATTGVVVGVLLAWGISYVGIPMPPLPNSTVGYTAHIRVVPGTVVTAFAIGFLATVVSASLAARTATRVPIVDALRQNV